MDKNNRFAITIESGMRNIKETYQLNAVTVIRLDRS